MIIRESNMNFIIPDQASLFPIEESKIMKNLGSGLKRVEFILLNHSGTVIFLEAKPSGYLYSEQGYHYDKHIQELVEKFENSIDIFFAVLSGRVLDKHHEVGKTLMNIDISQRKILCYVVINGKKEELYKAVALRLQQELKRRLQIYNMNLFVISKKVALEKNLIQNTEESPNPHQQIPK